MTNFIKFIWTVLLLFFSIVAFGQVTHAAIGETLKKMTVDKIVNDKTVVRDLHDLKGKPAILDFWATWCAPCILSMKHLEELKKTFGDSLTIVAISDENENTVKRYLNKNRLPFLFALDTTKRLNNYFPHLTIPHTVLIDKDLKVLAITEPYNITKETIKNVLRGESIALHEKKYQEFDSEKDYFQADSSTITKFQITDAIPSLPTRMQGWHRHPIFDGRRFTAINYTVENVLEQTFDDRNFKLTVFDSSAAALVPDGPLCFDIIVSKERRDSLFVDLRKYILQNFGIKVRIDSIEQPVYLLKKVEGYIFQEATGKQVSYSIPNGFKGYKVDSASITDFIKNCIQGNCPYLILDKTGLPGRYNIDFQYDFLKNFPFIAEGKDFIDNLRKSGFELEKSTGKGPALFIYK